MPSTPQVPMGAREWRMLLGLSVLWGGSFFFVEIALTGLPPLTLVFLRVALAALALWSLVLLFGQRPPGRPGAWGAFLVMALLNNAIPFSLIVWAQSSLTSGLAATLNATTPLFTVMLAGAMLPDERLTAPKLVGALLGFAGVAVLLGESPETGLASALPAQIAVLGAALSYAFAGIYGRRFRAMGLQPLVIAAGQLGTAALCMAPLALMLEQPFTLPAPPLRVALAVLALALVSTALAYVLYFRLLAAAGATNLLLVTLLIPVNAIVLGVLFLGETLTVAHLAGMLLIAVGLAAIDGRPWRRAAR